jgi:hypothetical protein
VGGSFAFQNTFLAKASSDDDDVDDNSEINSLEFDAKVFKHRLLQVGIGSCFVNDSKFDGSRNNYKVFKVHHMTNNHLMNLTNLINHDFIFTQTEPFSSCLMSISHLTKPHEIQNKKHRSIKTPQKNSCHPDGFTCFQIDSSP